MKPNKNLLITLSMISLMLLTACGLFNFAKEVTEVASEMKEFQESIDVGQPVQSGDKDGPQQVSGEDIDGVPLYRGAVRVHYLRQTIGDRVSTGVHYLVPASFEETMDFYRDEMRESDWMVKSQMETGEMFIMEAEDEQGGKLTFLIHTDHDYEEQYTMVAIGYEIREE
jgi:hypothetical protein